MLLGAATLALGYCCTSRVSNDIKKDTAIHGVEADMDAAYLTLSDAQRDIVTRNNDFGLRLFKNVSGMDSRVVSPLSVTCWPTAQTDKHDRRFSPRWAGTKVQRDRMRWKRPTNWRV